MMHSETWLSDTIGAPPHAPLLPGVDQAAQQTCRPMRDELPTLPYDLIEYARQSTLPDADDLDDHDDQDFTAGPLLDVRRSDVPRVAVSNDDLVAHSLDARAGFIVSLVDGASSVELILDVAGMPAGEALAILCELYARGLLAFD